MWEIERHKSAALVSMIVCMLAISGILTLVFLGCQGVSPQQTLNDEGYNEIVSGDIGFEWKIVDDHTLEVVLSAPTTGWVAVGFDPSSRMRDSNFILCAVVDSAPTARDDFGDSGTSHRADASLGGNDDVTIVSGIESDGATTVTFTVPLDSGDAFDRQLIAGNDYTVLLAYSNTDDFAAKHTIRTSVGITL